MLHVWCRGNSHTFVSLAWTCQIQKHWRLEEVCWDLTSSGCSWHGEMEDLLWIRIFHFFPLSVTLRVGMFEWRTFTNSASEAVCATCFCSQYFWKQRCFLLLKVDMRNSLFLFIFYIPSPTMLIRDPYSAEPTDPVVSHSPRHSCETSLNMEEYWPQIFKCAVCSLGTYIWSRATLQ